MLNEQIVRGTNYRYLEYRQGGFLACILICLCAMILRITSGAAPAYTTDVRCNRSHMKQDYEHSTLYRRLNHLLNLTRVAHMSDQRELI